MNRLLLPILIVVICVSLDGCKHSFSPSGPPTTGDVYRPVYAPYADVRTVQTMAPQPLKNAGKIYVKDNYLFINEVGIGIHVIDNSNPQNPVKLSFISIPGNHELSIKDSTLYADNVLDLVALNIADPRNVRLVKRIENAFEYSVYPLATNVRFECVDRDRGVVIRWEKASIDNPQCYR